jgi:hypothetical protein
MFDVVEFLKIAAKREGTEVERYEIACDHTRGGGCEVAYWSPESDGSEFRRVLQEISDGHVMVETFALAKHYTGDRTTSETAQTLRLQKSARAARIENAIVLEERRLAGLSEKQYRAWLKAGLITRNPEFNEIFECADRLGVQLGPS